MLSRRSAAASDGATARDTGPFCATLQIPTHGWSATTRQHGSITSATISASRRPTRKSASGSGPCTRVLNPPRVHRMLERQTGSLPVPFPSEIPGDIPLAKATTGTSRRALDDPGIDRRSAAPHRDCCFRSTREVHFCPASKFIGDHEFDVQLLGQALSLLAALMVSPTAVSPRA